MPVLTHIDGTDCGAILDGYVSVTPIDLNVTRQDVMDDLASFKDLEA